MNTEPLALEIRMQHRKRRYAMKVQQKIDRALESFVRRNYTDWTPDADESARSKYNAEVAAIIKAAKDEKGEPDLVDLVAKTIKSREPWDGVRLQAEKRMEKLAQELPVYPWVEGIRGAASLGLATIIAEAGPLERYANPAKLWKRLGFAPYDGLAGSSWKRETWRPRSLSKDEWIANPFSGERYALIIMLAESLFRSQWIGAKKTGTDVGKPNGHYGEVYAKRRAHTAIAHPDWTKQHSSKDGLRIMFKTFLRDLWNEWKQTVGQRVLDTQPIDADRAAASPSIVDAQGSVARRRTNSKRGDHGYLDAHIARVATAAGQKAIDAQRADARRTKKTKTTANDRLMPGNDLPSLPTPPVQG